MEDVVLSSLLRTDHTQSCSWDMAHVGGGAMGVGGGPCVTSVGGSVLIPGEGVQAPPGPAPARGPLCCQPLLGAGLCWQKPYGGGRGELKAGLGGVSFIRWPDCLARGLVGAGGGEGPG